MQEREEASTKQKCSLSLGSDVAEVADHVLAQCRAVRVGAFKVYSYSKTRAGRRCRGLYKHNNIVGLFPS
jgi:hypothetical protein